MRTMEDIGAGFLARTGEAEEIIGAIETATDKVPEVKVPAAGQIAWGVVATASMAASAYHGYKRNESIGWALWWGLMGSLFPVITPAIALGQGFGRPPKAK